MTMAGWNEPTAASAQPIALWLARHGREYGLVSAFPVPPYANHRTRKL
jgi:hypothetical protein